MKLALGTVQFGLPYGIANSSGQVDSSTVSEVLQYSQLASMDTLDTAIAYGESEQRLGEVGVNNWRVVTKLPELPEKCADVEVWVNEQIQGSLSRLKVDCLMGILLHKPSQLLGPKGTDLWDALKGIKKKGTVEKIGFSIYDSAELDVLYSLFLPDIIQAPYSILDCRLKTSGWLQRLYDADVEVHVRSVFLQGLLLMDKKDRPSRFDRWNILWDAWDAYLLKQGLTALQACLSFAINEPHISKVIVGVDNLNQLEEILSSTGAPLAPLPQILKTNDIDLITPSRWESL